MVLLPAFFLVPAVWTSRDLGAVAVLGFVCTALAHSLYVAAQKRVRAQTAGLISGLETVWGILYALVFLGEAPPRGSWPAGRSSWVCGGALHPAAGADLTAGRPKAHMTAQLLLDVLLQSRYNKNYKQDKD